MTIVTPEVRATYGPDVCTNHASLLVTTDYHGSKEEVGLECSDAISCGHASDVEFSGYDHEGTVFTAVWRAAGSAGDVWARQYSVASLAFGPAIPIGGASSEVLIDTNWVRRLGFDPNCALSSDGCGGAIWQTTTEGGYVLRWRQFTPDGTFGPMRMLAGFRGSGEVGCVGEAGALTCTRLLAFVNRDNRPDYPDALQTIQLDSDGRVIPWTLQTIYTVAKPVRIFQTAVVYSSAEERFLVSWAESRADSGDLPKTNGALKYLFLDFLGTPLGSHPHLAGYCEGNPIEDVMCSATKSDGTRHNGSCGCKGFFLAAAPDLSASYQDRYRIHHYGWGTRIAPDGAGTIYPSQDVQCTTHCPMAPALLESSQLVAYLKVDNAQYRYVWAGQPDGPLDAVGTLFAARLPTGWSWNGQGARSALSLDGYGRLVRRPIVAALAEAAPGGALEGGRLYLSLLQNIGGGCP